MPDCSRFRDVEIKCEDITFILHKKKNLQEAIQIVIDNAGINWLYTMEKVAMGNSFINFSNTSRNEFTEQVWEKDRNREELAEKVAYRILEMLEEGGGESRPKRGCPGNVIFSKSL